MLPGSNNNPRRPESKVSGIPPIFEAITGLLQAIACATVYENDSYISEATTTTSASA